MRLIITIMLSLVMTSSSFADTCWNRDYTVQHLAKQPHQTVTNIGFRMSQTINNRAKFGLFIKRRGSDVIYQARGTCQEQRTMFGTAEFVSCTVQDFETDESNGEFTITSSEKRGSILLHIAVDKGGTGAIGLWNHLAESVEWLDSGKSDTSFRLDLVKCR